MTPSLGDADDPVGRRTGRETGVNQARTCHHIPVVDGLTSRVLADATLASLRNSQRLIADAETLLLNGRYPTAHALAVLALEEFGKHVMCASANIRGHADEEYWRRFRRRFRDHRDKLRNALLLAGLMATTEEEMEPLDDLEAAAKREDFAKLRGLYVDLDRSGTVYEPVVTIGRQEAEKTVATVRLLVRLGGATFGDPDRVHAVFETLADRAGEAAAWAARAADDPMALALFGEALRSHLDSRAELPGVDRSVEDDSDRAPDI